MTRSRRVDMRSFMKNWNRGDIPSQVGKFAIVTGTGGLGYETALVLTAARAQVVLAGRNANKGNASVRSIRQEVPAALIQFEELDLASLASVEAFCTLLLKRGPM